MEMDEFTKNIPLEEDEQTEIMLETGDPWNIMLEEEDENDHILNDKDTEIMITNEADVIKTHVGFDTLEEKQLKTDVSLHDK